jgi:hypothetical protein
VQAVGPEAALLLIEAFGGTEIYVPRNPVPTSPLVAAIGAEAAAALAHAYGTNELRVPSAKRWRVRVYAARGASQKQISLKVGLNQRTVERYLAHPPAPGREPASQAPTQGALDF